MTSESTTTEDRYLVAPSPYDEALAKIPGLTWLPWVGGNYTNLPAGRKVLVVAESHYTNEQDPAKAPLSMDKTLQDRTYTRAVIQESMILQDWANRTFSAMHQLFFSPEDRAGFWGDLCFYNVVQRLMWYREGSPERPSWEDFWKGWEVFVQVVEVLQPDHVLFIGVEAANHFNNAMGHLKRDHTPVEFPEKIGSAYLMVLDASVAQAARLWIDKYGTGESVVVLCEEVTGPEFEALLREKADNALGLLLEHRFEEAEQTLSLANNGRELGERALYRAIAERHPDVTATTAFPLGIQWDFCGTLELAH